MSLHFTKAHNNRVFRTSRHCSLFVFSSIQSANLRQIRSYSLHSAASSWLRPATDHQKEALLATTSETMMLTGRNPLPHHPCLSIPKAARDGHHCFVIRDPTAPAPPGDHSRGPYADEQLDAGHGAVGHSVRHPNLDPNLKAHPLPGPCVSNSTETGPCCQRDRLPGATQEWGVLWFLPPKHPDLLFTAFPNSIHQRSSEPLTHATAFILTGRNITRT